MKKSILVLFVLSLFATSSMALTNGEIKKCTGMLHACFQGNYSLLVDLNPSSELECEDACNSALANLGAACDLAECVSRCNVAFDIDTVNMCD
jgi:hypothetical protein